MGMVRCPKCEKIMDSDIGLCRHCDYIKPGAEIDQMVRTNHFLKKIMLMLWVFISAVGILLILSFVIPSSVRVVWTANAEAAAEIDVSDFSGNALDAIVEEYVFSPSGSVAIQLSRYLTVTKELITEASKKTWR